MVYISFAVMGDFTKDLEPILIKEEATFKLQVHSLNKTQHQPLNVSKAVTYYEFLMKSSINSLVQVLQSIHRCSFVIPISLNLELQKNKIWNSLFRALQEYGKKVVPRRHFEGVSWRKLKNIAINTVCHFGPISTDCVVMKFRLNGPQLVLNLSP